MGVHEKGIYHPPFTAFLPMDSMLVPSFEEDFPVIPTMFISGDTLGTPGTH